MLPCVPSTVVPVPDVATVAPADIVLPLLAVVPTASMSASSGPLQKEEVDVLSEFLVFEDTSEFDIEPSTKDVATNTSPWKDSEAEVKRLEEVIRNQERTLRNNTSVIANLQRLLQKHLCLNTIFLCTMVQELERDRGLLHGRSLHVHPLHLFNLWFLNQAVRDLDLGVHDLPFG